MHHSRRGLLLLQAGVIVTSILMVLFDNIVVERPDLRTATYNIDSCGGVSRCNAQGAIDIMNIIAIASIALAVFVLIHTYSDRGDDDESRLVSEEHSRPIQRALWLHMGACLGYIFTLWYAVTKVQSHSEHDYDIVDMGPVIAPTAVTMCFLLPEILATLPPHMTTVIETYFESGTKARAKPAQSSRHRVSNTFSNPLFGMSED